MFSTLRSRSDPRNEPFMADQIVITEKTSQAKDIRAAVGSRYGDILPAEGHLFDLLEPEDVVPAWKRWSPILLRPEGLYGTRPAEGGNKAAKLKAIREALRTAKRVWLATDCDREGQLIGQEILEHYGSRGQVMRMLFTAQDSQTIRDAFSRAKPNIEYACLYAAAVARRQADQIYNLSLTRTATVKCGDEMPDWVGDKQKRLAKIQQAMAALEAEARQAAEEERRIEAEKEQQRQAEGRKKPGKPAAPPSDQPDPKSQRNFTDPESRIMKSKDGFVQAYNAQAAVDAGAQIIVAHELTQCRNDQGQLVPLIEAIENNLGRKPDQASADSGYCSESNLEALEAHGVDGYVAPGRAKHPTAAHGKLGGALTQRLRKKIQHGGFKTPYRLRKQVVEPVFGQIKQARGFRQFLLRGVEKVRAEWAMICTAHNLLKLFTLATAA